MYNQTAPDLVKCPKCQGHEPFEIVTRKISSESLRIIRCSNIKCQTFLAIVPVPQIDYTELISKMNANISTVNDNITSLNFNVITLGKIVVPAPNKTPTFQEIKKLKHMIHFDDF